MQAYPDPHAAGAQPLDDRARSLERAGRGGEGEEERVPLRVHLGPTALRARFADDPPVLGQRRGVILGAELVEKPG